MVNPLPREIRGLVNNQSSAIRKILLSFIPYYQDVVSNIQRESQIQGEMAKISVITDDALKSIGREMFNYSAQARRISVNKETDFLSHTSLPKIGGQEWLDYLTVSQRVANLSLHNFLTQKSLIDGRTLEHRLKTIAVGTEDTIEAILRVGMKEGKSVWQIGKEIEQYIAKDNRTRWTSPWTIERRARGFPISAPYKGRIPAGSVDYNAMRIARTELINNYRWSKIEATKGKDFVIGWVWSLSNAHPMPDVCDDWAAHDEGFGPGVYTDDRAIMGLGHPHCLCNVTTTTVFHKEMRDFFEKAYEDLDKPIKKYVDF